MTSSNQPLLSLETEIAEQPLLVRGFAGCERISDLFAFQLELAAKKDEARLVNSEAILGRPAAVRLAASPDRERFFHGIVARFSRTGDDDRFVYYKADLLPRIGLLSQSINCRVFQEKSIPQIIETVLVERGINDVRLALRGEYLPVDYCVQYRESDLDFISRLMEQEGIFYFFEHERERHTLVLADNNGVLQPVPRHADLHYRHIQGEAPGFDTVTSWESRSVVRTDRIVLRDFHFRVPDRTNEVAESAVQPTRQDEELEIYEPRGEYAWRFNEPDRDLELGQEASRLARIRMETEEAWGQLMAGASSCDTLLAGHVVDLDHTTDPRQSGQYLLTSVEHTACQSTGSFSGEDATASYRNSFRCLSAGTPFRPRRATPKPVIPGLQNAIVAGPPDSETHVDRFGRVKVQFAWDRYATPTESHSCWIRVAQFWAGQKWGAHFWPRVGHEVLVAFIDGDPNRPVITGSVYNASNMPPYELPENAHLSGIKSRSMPGGSEEHFNEIRFDDKKDREQIYIHAERNLDTEVEANEKHLVGGNQKISVSGSADWVVCKARSQEIGEGWEMTPEQPVADRMVVHGHRATRIAGDEDVMLCAPGYYSMEICEGDHRTKLSQGNRIARITGNDSLTVEQGGLDIRVNDNACRITAKTSIELVVGESSIVVDPSGVKIKGPMVQIEGEYGTTMNSKAVQVNGDVGVAIKGGIVGIN